jgi:hypothetical protein
MQFSSRFFQFFSSSAFASSYSSSSTSATTASLRPSKYLFFTMIFTVILLAHSATAFNPNQRFFDPTYLSQSDNLHISSVNGAKRNWNNAAVGLWGKRSGLPALYDISDDTPGAVVKRPQDSWTKLNSLWGKRSSWQTATGLWGKRSIPHKRFDTGVGSSSYEKM